MDERPVAGGKAKEVIQNPGPVTALDGLPDFLDGGPRVGDRLVCGLALADKVAVQLRLRVDGLEGVLEGELVDCEAGPAELPECLLALENADLPADVPGVTMDELLEELRSAVDGDRKQFQHP